MGIPPLGLLLDVDGPIASPLTRTTLHALGHQVTHVDVRPAGTLPAMPYPVLSHPSVRDDAAGAAHLRALVQHLG